MTSMRNPFRRRTNPATPPPGRHRRSPSDSVDFDRDVIAVGDHTDATSALMTLTMRTRGGVACHYEASTDEWVLTVGEDTYRAPTQLAALQEALAATEK